MQNFLKYPVLALNGVKYDSDVGELLIEED